MTDKEIIEALECCITGKSYADCESMGCPLYLGITLGCKYVDNENKLYADALDLITRQQAEIEELKIKLSSMRMAANSYKMHYEDGKSEAVKEFAEKSKKVWWDNGYESPDVDFDDFVDNLVKEMVGGT